MGVSKDIQKNRKVSLRLLEFNIESVNYKVIYGE